VKYPFLACLEAMGKSVRILELLSASFGIILVPVNVSLVSLEIIARHKYPAQLSYPIKPIANMGEL